MALLHGYGNHSLRLSAPRAKRGSAVPRLGIPDSARALRGCSGHSALLFLCRKSEEFANRDGNYLVGDSAVRFASKAAISTHMDAVKANRSTAAFGIVKPSC